MALHAFLLLAISTMQSWRRPNRAIVDLSRLRTGHGAKNMAVVRHFALNLVRQVADNRSIKRRRKRAAWDPQYLLEILGPRQPLPC
jgi:hypothetical protein